MKKELTKGDVYVVIDTPKRAKKLKKVLDMFGEEFSHTDGNAIKKGAYKGSAELYTEFNKAYFTGHNWTLTPTCSEKSEVSIKQLRNILAVEHLKEGDVVIAGINSVNNKWIVKFESFRVIIGDFLGYYAGLDNAFELTTFTGSFDNFIRYATEAEKELLRVNSLKEQAKEVIKPVKDELTEDDYKDKTWYKSTHNGSIFFLDKLIKKHYGFCGGGIGWIESGIQWFNKLGKLEEATHQEVEKALIEEAKRRGLLEIGIRFLSPDSIDYGYSYNGHKVVYLMDSNVLGFEDKDVISSCVTNLFDNGNWATIVEQDKFAELKEAHKNGAVIQLNSIYSGWYDVEDEADLWLPIYEYRIKPEEKTKVGDLVKAWDNDERDFVIGKLKDIDSTQYPFKITPTWFKNAKKITPKEALDLLTENCR